MLCEDTHDVTTLTPNIFFKGIKETRLKDFENLGRKFEWGLKKRHRYLQKLGQGLRKTFWSEYLGQFKGVKEIVNNENLNTIREIVLATIQLALGKGFRTTGQ